MASAIKSNAGIYDIIEKEQPDVRQLIKNAIESVHIHDVCFSFRKNTKPLNIPTQIIIVITPPNIPVAIKISTGAKCEYKLPRINIDLWNNKNKKRMQNLTFCIL